MPTRSLASRSPTQAASKSQDSAGWTARNVPHSPRPCRTRPTSVARTSWPCGCCSPCACARWSCCRPGGPSSTWTVASGRCTGEYLFPPRRLIQMKGGVPRRNRFGQISPDTLNVALRRLPLDDIEHFTVHDMRRTARTHMAALGVDRFVAERALNHKVRDVEGVYNQYDYFDERKVALERWAKWLAAIEEARNGGAPSTQASEDAMAALAKQAQKLAMGYERSGRRSSADDTHSP